MFVCVCIFQVMFISAGTLYALYCSSSRENLRKTSVKIIKTPNLTWLLSLLYSLDPSWIVDSQLAYYEYENLKNWRKERSTSYGDINTF